MKILFGKILDLVYTVDVTCMCCGEELREKAKNCLCRLCYDLPEPTEVKTRRFDKVTVHSVCRYDRFGRDFVLRIKTGEKPEMAKVLAMYIAELYRELELSCDCIAYVPSSKANKKARGYDHMKLCAGFLRTELALPVVKGFRRIKQGVDQTEILSYDERKKNIAGCFEYTGESLAGKTVLLVDDIITSGATMNECALTLTKAKPDKIVCITFARAESVKS